jgi:hypothetical protein
MNKLGLEERTRQITKGIITTVTVNVNCCAEARTALRLVSAILLFALNPRL